MICSRERQIESHERKKEAAVAAKLLIFPGATAAGAQALAEQEAAYAASQAAAESARTVTYDWKPYMPASQKGKGEGKGKGKEKEKGKSKDSKGDSKSSRPRGPRRGGTIRVW